MSKFLVTTKNYFIAPDGEWYSAVFGTKKETTVPDTVIIGNVTIPKEQVVATLKTEEVSDAPPTVTIKHEGEALAGTESSSRIYRTD